MHLNPIRTGLAVGLVLGLWHAGWALLVALSWAQPLLDLVLRLHFIRLNIEIQGFDLNTAAQLVGLTFAIGALIGLVFAWVWNALHRADDATVLT